jgi:alpha-methylacyl-CoA racemase
MSGPLKGITVVEFAGIGPAPFCAMMLSDMGANVIRIDKPGNTDIAGILKDTKYDITGRGRRSLALDLKNPESPAIALKLIEKADVLIEGYRPGVMERIGLGPDVCLKRNKKLVYGRMTGWGQSGPLADKAGHDINYIALSGALHAMGEPDKPPIPPLNLVGDYGGGGVILAFGLVCALLEAKNSGKGQVIDAAMTDGSALLMSFMYGLKSAGIWDNDRGANILDGSAPFYRCYECADGKYMAVGALEPQFYQSFINKMGVNANLSEQHNKNGWPDLKKDLKKAFKTKTRDEWCDVFKEEDACVSPVLDLDEAPNHNHNTARATFKAVSGIEQPTPAPHFSRTKEKIQRPPASAGQHSIEILKESGFSASKCKKLIKKGVVYQLK